MNRQYQLPLEMPPRERGFFLFHDESGFTGGTRYGVHALLAVPDGLVRPLTSELARVRRDSGYEHEIHFKDLTARMETSAEWLTSRDWLRILFTAALEGVRFKAFVVDMHHDEFDRARYPNESAAFRRFSISVAKSLIAWSLRGEGIVNLTAFTDRGNPSAHRMRRDGDLFDKFHVYVQNECLRAKRGGKAFYPDVRFRFPLREVDSKPSKLTHQDATSMGCSFEDLRGYSDLVQLVDLVAGCINACLTMPRSEGKLELAETFARRLASAYELPWHRARDRTRALSVSVFPGAGRMPYAISLRGIKAAGIRAVRSDSRLRELFETRHGFRPDAVLYGQPALWHLGARESQPEGHSGTAA